MVHLLVYICEKTVWPCVLSNTPPRHIPYEKWYEKWIEYTFLWFIFRTGTRHDTRYSAHITLLTLLNPFFYHTLPIAYRKQFWMSYVHDIRIHMFLSTHTDTPTHLPTYTHRNTGVYFLNIEFLSLTAIFLFLLLRHIQLHTWNTTTCTAWTYIWITIFQVRPVHINTHVLYYTCTSVLHESMWVQGTLEYIRFLMAPIYSISMLLKKLFDAWRPSKL